ETGCCASCKKGDFAMGKPVPVGDMYRIQRLQKSNAGTLTSVLSAGRASGLDLSITGSTGSKLNNAGQKRNTPSKSTPTRLRGAVLGQLVGQARRWAGVRL